MAKLNWLPTGVKYADVKPDLGFTTKDDKFNREPVLNTKAYPGDNGGFTRVTTTNRVLMASVAALKAANMPENPDEGKVEISCEKGKLHIWPVK